ncbi:MAG: hypothetical protein II948_03925 [Synergistaceae bacterium]|nr:hypothetical protein [Synergistaceae bacterium]MBQ6909079.1 hypothetical protein [Synergistaceae bacterium]MBQ7569574.1 hypothetical protein [Synergistaceae bacterium]MBQ9581004.1 hypothetical protein [Synergistaceae bacterium]MBQ9897000.1 hypothetical protein [Synergistaceae bacterium]
MLSPEIIKKYLLIGSAIFLSITIFACLLRAILGPRFTDRIIAANIIGTKTIALISIMSLIVGEDYLVDICLIYAIISFMSVVVLARSVIERKNKNNTDGKSSSINNSININNNASQADELRSMIQQIWRSPFSYIFEEQ